MKKHWKRKCLVLFGLEVYYLNLTKKFQNENTELLNADILVDSSKWK